MMFGMHKPWLWVGSRRCARCHQPMPGLMAEVVEGWVDLHSATQILIFVCL